MRAVVTQPGLGRAWLQEMHEPSPTHADDVLIQMLRVGVCGTDRHVMQRAFNPSALAVGITEHPEIRAEGPAVRQGRPASLSIARVAGTQIGTAAGFRFEHRGPTLA